MIDISCQDKILSVFKKEELWPLMLRINCIFLWHKTCGTSGARFMCKNHSDNALCTPSENHETEETWVLIPSGSFLAVQQIFLPERFAVPSSLGAQKDSKWLRLLEASCLASNPVSWSAWPARRAACEPKSSQGHVWHQPHGPLFQNCPNYWKWFQKGFMICIFCF